MTPEEKREYHRKWRKEHPDHANVWRKNNPEKVKAYYQKNRDKLLAKQNAWYAAHREERLVKNRERYAKKRQTQEVIVKETRSEKNTNFLRELKDTVSARRRLDLLMISENIFTFADMGRMGGFRETHITNVLSVEEGKANSANPSFYEEVAKFFEVPPELLFPSYEKNKDAYRRMRTEKGTRAQEALRTRRDLHAEMRKTNSSEDVLCRRVTVLERRLEETFRTIEDFVRRVDSLEKTCENMLKTIENLMELQTRPDPTKNGKGQWVEDLKKSVLSDG